MKRSYALLAVVAALSFAGAAQAGVIHSRHQPTPYKATMDFQSGKHVKNGKEANARGFPSHKIHSKSFRKHLHRGSLGKLTRHKPGKLPPKHKHPGNYTQVPEPASLALIGAGLFGLVAARRRRT